MTNREWLNQLPNDCLALFLTYGLLYIWECMDEIGIAKTIVETASFEAIKYGGTNSVEHISKWLDQECIYSNNPIIVNHNLTQELQYIVVPSEEARKKWKEKHPNVNFTTFEEYEKEKK